MSAPHIDISQSLIFVRKQSANQLVGDWAILDMTGAPTRPRGPQAFGSELVSEFGSWSIVRDEIAYDVKRATDIRQVFRVGKEGKNSIAVSPPEFIAWNPTWSPDGKHIAFAAQRRGTPNALLYVSDLDTSSEPRQLTFGQKWDQHPQWSPDGRSILFESDRSGNWNLWLLPVNRDAAATGPPVQVTFASSDGVYHRPFWAPDSKSITYVFGKEGQGRIFRLELTVTHSETGATVTAGNTKPLTSGPDEQGTITPDGSRLIFTRIGDQGRRQIFALPLNEGSAPQALTPDNWDCSTYLYIP